MKVLVLCLLVTAALGEAAPSDGLPGDTPAPLAAPPAFPASQTYAEKTPADSAAVHAVKVEPAAVHAGAAVDHVDAVKIEAQAQDKKDAFVVEPVVEAAEPSGPSVHDSLPANSPVKKVPVFVPVEYAAAYHPDNFFNQYPVSSGLGGYVADPYRSVVRPWYQLVSPEVPLLTLYPGEQDESYRASCAEPALRYIHNAPTVYTGPSAPVVYTGPSAPVVYTGPYAAPPLVHPYPYQTQMPYYKFSLVPDSSAHIAPSVDYSRSTLISHAPAHKVSPFSPVSRISHSHTTSPDYIYPGSFNFNPFVRQISPVPSVRFYATSGMHVPGQFIHV